MHELSIAIEILDMVLPKIPEGGRLQSVQVTAGPLSGICSDSLNFCFVEMAGQEGHPGAKLEITRPSIRYRCYACKSEYFVDQVEVPCPSCRSLERTMLSGAEFTVDFIEFEEGDCHV
jgi:Zn finger protein HypA/HybF involved in hydrogenase expression